jgi:hypothetical protein
MNKKYTEKYWLKTRFEPKHGLFTEKFMLYK